MGDAGKLVGPERGVPAQSALVLPHRPAENSSCPAEWEPCRPDAARSAEQSCAAELAAEWLVEVAHPRFREWLKSEPVAWEPTIPVPERLVKLALVQQVRPV